MFNQSVASFHATLAIFDNMGSINSRMEPPLLQDYDFDEIIEKLIALMISKLQRLNDRAMIRI